MKKLIPFFVIAVLSLSATFGATADAKIPPPNGQLVRDLTGTVDEATVRQLNDRVLAFNSATSVELVALVVPSLNGLPLEEYSLKVLHDWGVGDKAKDNGIVYVWCPSERVQRIEVGYGLEPFMPDIAAKRIIEEVKVRVPRDPPGPRLTAMVEAIIVQLEMAKRAEAAPELTAKAAVTEGPSVGKFVLILLFFVLVIVIILVIINRVTRNTGHSPAYTTRHDYYERADHGAGRSRSTPSQAKPSKPSQSRSSTGGSYDGGSVNTGSSGGSDSGGGFTFGGGDGGGGGASGSD